MSTIHEDIEPWLAAAVHDQLTPEERAAFENHLADCAECRALHQEELTMNTMIASTFETAKPDLAFERRVVSRFRRQARARGSVTGWFAHLWRYRAMQLTAVAAVLLTLLSVGHWLSHPASLYFLGNEELAVRAVPSPGSFEGLREQLGKREVEVQMGRDLPASPPSVSGGGMRPQSSGFANTATMTAPSDSSGPRPSVAAPPAPQQAETDKLNVLQKRNADSAASEDSERVVVTGSWVPTAEEVTSDKLPNEAQPVPPDNRKLVRNAQVELEIIKFDEAVVKITAFAAEDGGYIATSSSEKQANGKLQGQIVAKVLPANLDRFLLKLRGLGELKNQVLGTEDVTKQYFDTDARLKNARVMEQRLIDILKTNSTKVADLLEVEKELGRVRASVEEMQGALKYLDAQVQFATVTISLAEKDLDQPAAFLLKRRATLALFSTDVEKTFGEVKAVVDGTKAQISSSTLGRDSAGEATARLVLLIAPEEADALIERIKSMGRVQNYNEQTDRVAQGGGTGMAENAKVERDKVELSVTISRNEQEPALQTTTLTILTSAVADKVAQLKENAEKSGAEIRSSSFKRDPSGQEYADIGLRVSMKNYPTLLKSFDQLGKVKDVGVQRDDRRGTINEATAPADINIRVYSQPDVISDENGLFATIRRTIVQGATALMWSLRMIGVAIAFLAPWVVALLLVRWIMKRISRARQARRESRE